MLIEFITTLQFSIGGRVFRPTYEYPGFVSVGLAEGVDLYATPDWDEENTIPITIERNETGELLEAAEVLVTWTGDAYTDSAIWWAIVSPYVLKHTTKPEAGAGT